MKRAIIVLCIVTLFSIPAAQVEKGETRMDTSRYVDLNKIPLEKNSDLFRVDTLDNEQVLVLKNNVYNQEIDPFTGKVVDDVRGKVLLLGGVKRDYAMAVEMKFLATHINLE
ncbi:MAG: hypothetical protein JSV84_05865 [Gemmatimonadota bacterium]|nr:MAG: hypothetical protein JSV84_05865 [Gemmatimonadota bacterium]